jgi:hypothetical protein
MGAGGISGRTAVCCAPFVLGPEREDRAEDLLRRGGVGFMEIALKRINAASASDEALACGRSW